VRFVVLIKKRMALLLVNELIDRMTKWVVEQLGKDVPMHFSAFHPAWKMMDLPPTPEPTLKKARRMQWKTAYITPIQVISAIPVAIVPIAITAE
jgi:hypothetical protein